jgi:creatinine amidohydrolase
MTVDLISAATTTDEASRAADVAVLPIGSFEQHGSHPPLATDTIVASAIARAVAETCNLLLLPPVTISCSQEHAGWSGSVSIRASTHGAIITDVAESARRAGVEKMVVVNGQGGNYVLSNVVQEANTESRRMARYLGTRTGRRLARRPASRAAATTICMLARSRPRFCCTFVPK